MENVTPQYEDYFLMSDRGIPTVKISLGIKITAMWYPFIYRRKILENLTDDEKT